MNGVASIPTVGWRQRAHTPWQSSPQVSDPHETVAAPTLQN